MSIMFLLCPGNRSDVLPHIYPFHQDTGNQRTLRNPTQAHDGERVPHKPPQELHTAPHCELRIELGRREAVTPGAIRSPACKQNPVLRVRL